LAEAHAFSEAPGTGTEQQSGGELDAPGRVGPPELDPCGEPKAGPKVAAILSIVESCRRMKIPIRDYLAGVLPGLADVSIQRLADLTPVAWAARHPIARPAVNL